MRSEVREGAQAPGTEAERGSQSGGADHAQQHVDSDSFIGSPDGAQRDGSSGAATERRTISDPRVGWYRPGQAGDAG